MITTYVYVVPNLVKKFAFLGNFANIFFSNFFLAFLDDNVHYQQSMMMARALEEADVLFQQLSYPDENHGLVGLRPHFYHSLSNFILNDCFGRNEVFKK